MRVFVTGAGGFLGQAVVRAAQDTGHEVTALRRPTSSAAAPPGIRLVVGDLRQPSTWADALDGVDAVIHCAAAAGDLATQLAGTVLATENLLAALPPSVRRIVHVSSFSVYDFDAAGRTGRLDESTPIEQQPLRRDPYTLTKIIQERLVVDHALRENLDLVVVRPGAIYGPGKDWDLGRAMQVGRFDLIFAPFSPMRLIHVDNCADAIVAALSAAVEAPLVVNLVDSEQPSHWRYHRQARRSGIPVGIAIPVPYVMVGALGAAARLASRLFFANRAKLPEMLDQPRQRVRWRSLRYANDRAREKLNWRQRLSLAQGIDTLVQSGIATEKQALAPAKDGVIPKTLQPHV